MFGKKMISLLLVISLTIVTLPQAVRAADNFSDTITVDGYVIEIVTNDDDATVVKTMVDGVQYVLELDKEEESYELETKEYSSTIFGIGIGIPEIEIYSIEVEDTTDDCIVADVIPETDHSDIVHIDETMVEAQASLIIGTGLGAIALALLKALLAVAASIVVAGVIYYAASSVAHRLKRDQPQVHYYMAYLNYGDNVYIGPKLNSKSAAAARLKSGLNVFAISSGYAYDACKSASPINLVSSQQKHSGAGKNYWHYHPMDTIKKQGAGHCWFI
jgi:ribosomal protein L25 (general stress protein Ctc)